MCFAAPPVNRGSPERRLKVASSTSRMGVRWTRPAVSPGRGTAHRGPCLGPSKAARFACSCCYTSASVPSETPRPPPEGLLRRLSQAYLASWSWCASSPKDPVIATSPAYHDHPPQRLLQNFPDTTPVSLAKVSTNSREAHPGSTPPRFSSS